MCLSVTCDPERPHPWLGNLLGGPDLTSKNFNFVRVLRDPPPLFQTKKILGLEGPSPPVLDFENFGS